MIKDFSVPNPCNENWNGMSPKDNGLYCNSCQKVVIDFTNKTKEEIINYINANARQKMCGTFKTSTLIPVKENQTTILFLVTLLLVFGMALFSCNETQVNSDLINEQKTFTTAGITLYKHDSILPPPILETIKFVPPEITEKEVATTMGVMAPVNPDFACYDTLNDDTTVYNFVKKMPEFPGGTLALNKYILNNLNYSIERCYINAPSKFYINFIVKKDGSITNIKNLRPSNTSYDEQIIELVKNMPQWIPGEKDNKPVNVRFTLPIRICFK